MYCLIKSLQVVQWSLILTGFLAYFLAPLKESEQAKSTSIPKFFHFTNRSHRSWLLISIWLYLTFQQMIWIYARVLTKWQTILTGAMFAGVFGFFSITAVFKVRANPQGIAYTKDCIWYNGLVSIALATNALLASQF